MAQFLVRAVEVTALERVWCAERDLLLCVKIMSSNDDGWTPSNEDYYLHRQLLATHERTYGVYIGMISGTLAKLGMTDGDLASRSKCHRKQFGCFILFDVMPCARPRVLERRLLQDPMIERVAVTGQDGHKSREIIRVHRGFTREDWFRVSREWVQLLSVKDVAGESSVHVTPVPLMPHIAPHVPTIDIAWIRDNLIAAPGKRIHVHRFDRAYPMELRRGVMKKWLRELGYHPSTNGMKAKDRDCCPYAFHYIDGVDVKDWLTLNLRQMK